MDFGKLLSKIIISIVVNCKDLKLKCINVIRLPIYIYVCVQQSLIFEVYFKYRYPFLALIAQLQIVLLV